MTRPAVRSRPFELEVCVDRLDAALAVVEAGATRVEFNQALDLAGLTPSISSCRWLAEHCPQPVVVMNRPHHRGFVYSPSEQRVMLDDCRALADAGVAGVVLGALDARGKLDLKFLAAARQACRSIHWIMHRAFDALHDQREGLSHLIDLGCDRVLTSGGADSAMAGAEQLQRLVNWSAGQIEILPGGGVASRHAQTLIARTGCQQLHGSFRMCDGGATPDLSEVRRVVARNSFRVSLSSGATPDLSEVRRVRRLLEVAIG